MKKWIIPYQLKYCCGIAICEPAHKATLKPTQGYFNQLSAVSIGFFLEKLMILSKVYLVIIGLRISRDICVVTAI